IASRGVLPAVKASAINRPSAHDRLARVMPLQAAGQLSPHIPAGSSWTRPGSCFVTPGQFTAHMRIPRMTLPRRQDWFGVALLACGWLALAGPARAQDAVIRGRVVNDRGEALPVATVQVPELNIGVFTSNDGRYSIQVPAARVSGQVVTLR